MKAEIIFVLSVVLCVFSASAEQVVVRNKQPGIRSGYVCSASIIETEPFLQKLIDWVASQEVPTNAPIAWAIELAAWEALPFCACGVHLGDKQYGSAAERRMYCLADSVEKLSVEDDAIYAVAYALSEGYFAWRNPNVKEATLKTTRKLLAVRESNGLWKSWRRTGLVVQTLRTESLRLYPNKLLMADYGDVLKSVAESVKKELQAGNLSDEAVAVGGMILMMTGNVKCDEAKKAIGIMSKWKFADERSEYATFCATTVLRSVVLGRGATDVQRATWSSWTTDLKQACASIEVNKENEARCLWLALDYLSALRRILPTLEEQTKTKRDDVAVEVDI